MTRTGPPRLKLDHITVVAPDLEAGVAHVARCLGVTVPFGGAHPLMGTHNALTRIGEDIFLEIISIDPLAPPPGRPRWFGLDSWSGEPRLATYVLGTEAIHTSLQEGLAQAGEAVEAKRGDLTWLISVPPDGSRVLDGAYPSLIQWPADDHPAQRMPDLGCRLLEFAIEHPEAQAIEDRLRPAFEDPQVRFAVAPEARLTATFETPSGTRVLE